MNTPNTVFVSTAIPYVNAPPHLGFALEVVLADVFARHARARGDSVHFVTGTDDNSLSNVRAAEARGISTRELVDENTARFRALDRTLDASFDDFLRTSVSPTHHDAVHAFWEACAKRGDLERRPYRGNYCVGCEQFLAPSDLVHGACPEHLTVPEIVEEQNWFFRLSRFERPIREALASGRIRIEPPERAHEIERFLEGGLQDISVSRSRTRARGWGIPVPGDPEQVIWVWFDALASYAATLGFPHDRARHDRHWRHAKDRVHVLGKGILRFHAILWPALLLAADLALPTTLWVHGYLTVGGSKIGKSRGNAIAPEVITDRYGVDALRYFLLRHVGGARDADVDLARVDEVYRTELADGLGNLLARTVALVRANPPVETTRARESFADDEPTALALAACSASLEGRVSDALDRLAPDEALRAIWDVVGAANKHLGNTAPWTLAKDPANAQRVQAVLERTRVALDAIARALVPLLPSTARRITEALASRPAPILFPKPPKA